MGKILDQRTSRARVLLDIEDMRILGMLADIAEKNQAFSLDGLKKRLNISHNSLLVHVKRLGGLRLIDVFRMTNTKDNKEAYKMKTILLRKEGKKVLDILTDQDSVCINGKMVGLWK